MRSYTEQRSNLAIARLEADLARERQIGEDMARIEAAREVPWAYMNRHSDPQVWDEDAAARYVLLGDPFRPEGEPGVAG